jgi:hypothetical protein
MSERLTADSTCATRGKGPRAPQLPAQVAAVDVRFVLVPERRTATNVRPMSLLFGFSNNDNNDQRLPKTWQR